MKVAKLLFIFIISSIKLLSINCKVESIGNTKCMWIDIENNNVIDLIKLKRLGDIDLFMDFRFKNDDYLLAYNFCEDTIAINGNYKSSQVSLLNKNYEFQRIFSGANESGNMIKYIDNDINNGIKLIMNVGEQCHINGNFFNVNWNLKCVSNMSNEKYFEILNYEYDDLNCVLTINANTKECKINVIF